MLECDEIRWDCILTFKIWNGVEMFGHVTWITDKTQLYLHNFLIKMFGKTDKHLLGTNQIEPPNVQDEHCQTK